MSRGGAGGGATTISDPAPSSPFMGGGGGGGVSSSSVLMMSVSGVAGQLGMTGGGTAFPKLELREKIRRQCRRRKYRHDDVLSRE